MVAVLNVTTILGLPIAIGCYLLANRLLPLNIPDRGQWEIDILFLVWGGCLAYALLRPASKIWRELLIVAAAVFIAVPVVNALTTGLSFWTGHTAGNWLWFVIDAFALLLAAVCTWLAMRQTNQQQPDATGKQP